MTEKQTRASVPGPKPIWNRGHGDLWAEDTVNRAVREMNSQQPSHHHCNSENQVWDRASYGLVDKDVILDSERLAQTESEKGR